MEESINILDDNKLLEPAETEEVIVNEETPKVSKTKKVKVEAQVEEVLTEESKEDTVDSDNLWIINLLKYKAEVYNDLYEAVRKYKTYNYIVIQGNDKLPTYMILVHNKEPHYCISRFEAKKYNIHGK